VNSSGAAATTRFDTKREDDGVTGEIGLRGRFVTGQVKHQVVASASRFRNEGRNAWEYNFNPVPINIYSPVGSDRLGGTTVVGNLTDPNRAQVDNLQSYALADTLSFLDDRVLLTLGLRHQTIEQKSYSNATDLQTDSYKKSATTPVAGLVFKATSQLSLYANYVEGLVKGDVAPTTTSSNEPVLNAGQVFSPYKARQKEVGVKWQQRGLGASAAFYTMDTPESYVQNQVFGEYGTTRYRGLELNVFGEPLKGLRVLGGMTFTDAKLKSTEGGVGQGNHAIGVPRRQLTLGGEWDVPGVQGLALNARLIHTSSQYANAANTLKVKDWTRTDLGVRYLMDIGNDRLLTLRARVDNVFDKQYWASVGGFPGSNYLVQSNPRTFAISASVDF
jgi:iron complex outermembrane receptor protein